MDQNLTDTGLDTNSESAPKDNKSWLFFGVGFILGAVVFFFVGQNYVKPVPIKDPFVGAKYGIAGKVVLAEDNLLTIGVDAAAFGMPVIAYKVYVDGKTIFKKAVYAKNTSAGLNIFGQKPISVATAVLSDITLGSNVVAKSKENFGNLKEFIASEIEVQTYQ